MSAEQNLKRADINNSVYGVQERRKKQKYGKESIAKKIKYKRKPNSK